MPMNPKNKTLHKPNYGSREQTKNDILLRYKQQLAKQNHTDFGDSKLPNLDIKSKPSTTMIYAWKDRETYIDKSTGYRDQQNHPEHYSK